MDFLISFFNFMLLGMLASLTVRWVRMQYNAYKIKDLQKGPFGRKILISSEEVLKGVLRKRYKKASHILGLELAETMVPISERDTVGDTMRKRKAKKEQLTGVYEILSEDTLDSIYNSFKERGLEFYLIPNEDVYLANKKGTLSEPSHYYLNDEIYTRKSNKEQADEIRKREEIKKKEKERKQLEERLQNERQTKLKEKQIEDQINI